MTRSLRAVAMAALLVVALPTAVAGTLAQEEQVTLTIEVVAQGGETVGGADLTVTWEGGSESTTTRANGQALVDVPRGSNPTIEVDHDIYMRNFPLELTNVSQGLVQVPVARSGSVAVTVQGSTGPMEGATVRLVRSGRNAASARSGADGTVVVGPVERGEYGLAVGKPGYLTNASTIQVTDRHERTVQIRPGAVQLRFNITDDHFSPAEPVESARISIAETGDNLTTLENGQRATTAPVNRQYTVTVRKEGYQTVERTVSVREAGLVVDVGLSRTPDLNVELVNRRVVIGESTILTATNEYAEPVANATVRLQGTVVGTTDAQGTVQLPVESVGANTIEVSHGGISNSTVVEGVEAATPTTVTTTTQTSTSSGSGPGFTAALALVSMLAAAGLAARRHR